MRRREERERKEKRRVIEALVVNLEILSLSLSRCDVDDNTAMEKKKKE